MAKLKAVLFDLDGTLVDSNARHVDGWEQALREAGHAFSRAEIQDQIGKGGDNFVPALPPGLDEAAAEQLDERHGEVFKGECMAEVRPFAGARDLLLTVRSRGLAVVLAPSAGADELDHDVGLLDAAAIVDHRTGKDDVTHSKPDPDIFRAALGAAAVGPAEAIVIGDTPYDATASAPCGVRSIRVLSGGFAEDALRAAGAIAIYRDVADLLATLETSPIAG